MFSHITTIGSSKICLGKALDKLLDMRVILMDGEEDGGGRDRGREVGVAGDRELVLSIPYEDLREVIMDMEDIPAVIKEILTI